MNNLIIKIVMETLLAIVDCILLLRYQITWKNFNEIKKAGTSGTLFLPNHPALIDPVIMTLKLRKIFKPVALADEEQINVPVIRNLAAYMGLITLPNIAKAGAAGGAETHRALDELVSALKSGQNVLLYPSGRLYRSKFENLRATSSVSYILDKAPETRIVAVRTQGLWGSRFSHAHGEPDTVRGIFQSLKDIILNGIFFLPKREVTIEFSETEDLPRNGSNQDINKYLESIYNKDSRPNIYVPYSFWRKTERKELPDPDQQVFEGDLEDVPKSVRELVLNHLKDISGKSTVKIEDKLAEDLGIDSLRMLDVLEYLEKEFGVSQTETDSLITALDLMLAAAGKGISNSEFSLSSPPNSWFRSFKKEDLQIAEGNSITDLFLKQAAKTPLKAVYADQKSGVKTYRDTVLACLVLSPIIRKLPGEYVGIMMPASVGGAVFYLASLFAGKIPVMINWTVGSRNLQHSVDSLGIQKIITAKALCDNLTSKGVHFGNVTEAFLYVEELSKEIQVKDKITAALRSRFSWRSLRHAQVADTAAVLFTSGSESLPKAVPLSHQNIVSNIRNTLKYLNLTSEDSFCGILPPFHSFGLAVCVVAPAIGGISIAYHTNPTEGPLIGKLIEVYKLSALLGTPTFLSGIVNSSSSENLESLKLIVTGAEACPDKVYEIVKDKCPDACMIEGYGITECSPIVSVTPVIRVKRGTVGKPILSLKYKVVNPETNEEMPDGEQGMLLVSGDSIFSGYLNYDGPSPFVEFEDETYYKTGDLVYLDEDHYIIFGGRLKRFIKVGGEMISLPAIETALLEALADRIPEEQEGPLLAIETLGEEGKEEITLFATLEISREEVNDILRATGFSALYNIRRVILLEEIPLLGSGKINYRELKNN